MKPALRFLVLAAAWSLAACSSTVAVPCSSDAQCEKFGAVCSQGYCALPRDLSVADLAAPDLSTRADLDVPDLEPDLLPSACVGPCPSSAPICGIDGQCHPCGASDDAACVARSRNTPTCDIATGACVSCKTAMGTCSDPAFPVCGFDGSCRAGCSINADCPSGVCDPAIVSTNGNSTSSCAWSDEIVYAEGGVSCAGTGTQSAPYCSLVTAVAALPNGGFIRALGSATSLPRLSTTISGPYVIVGDGPTATTLSDTLVPPASYPALVTVGAGGALSLQDIGLVGVGAMVCSSATLKLADVSIENAVFSTGLASTDCDLTIDRFRVEKCVSGIAVSGGTVHQLTNAIVASNSGTGIHFATGTTVGTIGYLTVANNTPSASTTVGGIQCDVAVNISDSIIWGNQVVGSHSIAGSCALTYTDIAPAESGTGNLSLAPTFTSDYHLSTSPATVNDLCCKDKALAIPNVTWDIDYDTRFNLYIGADEIKSAI